MNPADVNGHIAEEPSDAGGALDAAWRPAGLVYLAAMLIALAVGLWPGSIRASVDPYSPASTPAVQTLTIGQVGFYLVAYPVIVLFRASGKRPWRWWPDTVIETLFWTLLGAAFFVPAVWLSGSSVSDAIRGMVYVCGFWPMAWVCGAWLASRKAGGSAVMFVSILAAMGLPWLWYVSVEFFPPAGWHDVLWKLCPVTQGWDVAAPRGGQGGLSPVWAIVIWPAMAAAMFALWVIVPARNKAGQDAS